MRKRKICLLLPSVAGCVGCGTTPTACSPLQIQAPQDQAAIKGLEDHFVSAFNAKDASTIMSLYVPDQSLIVFDLDPPLQYTGADAYRKDWDGFFAEFPGPAHMDLSRLDITAGGNVACGARYPACHDDRQERQETRVHCSRDRWVQKGRRQVADQSRACLDAGGLRQNERSSQRELSSGRSCGPQNPRSRPGTPGSVCR